MPTSWIETNFLIAIEFYWQHITESGGAMLCNAKLRTRNGKQKMDGEKVWKKLEENKEMISINDYQV